MRVAVDISLYPIADEFILPIDDVIDRLNRYDAIEVTTNPLSTQLFGEYEDVMQALHREIGKTFEDNERAVFAIRILNNPVTA